MQIFLDISCLVLIFVVIMVCWKRGFLRNLFGAARIVIALVVTYMFGGAFSAWIKERFFGEKVQNFVEICLGNAVRMATGTEMTADNVKGLIPEWLANLLDTLGIDLEEMVNSVNLEANLNELVESLSSKIAEPLSNMISTLLGYSLLFFLIMIALRVVQFLLKGISKLPGVHFIDQAMGLVWGIAMAAVFVSGYTMLLYGGFSMLEGQNPEIGFQEAYSNSLIFKWLYEHNLFRALVGID